MEGMRSSVPGSAGYGSRWRRYVGLVVRLVACFLPFMMLLATWGPYPFTPKEALSWGGDDVARIVIGLCLGTVLFPLTGLWMMVSLASAFDVYHGVPMLLSMAGFNAILLGLGVWTLLRWLGRRRAAKDGRCIECGHQLVEAQVDCPECGCSRGGEPRDRAWLTVGRWTAATLVAMAVAATVTAVVRVEYFAIVASQFETQIQRELATGGGGFQRTIRWADVDGNFTDPMIWGWDPAAGFWKGQG
jgi:hypothetical protein